MALPLIDHETLTILPGKGQGAFTHRIELCRRPKSEEIYYLKAMESKRVAVIEALAQEFFRLIAPWQPKTLIASDSSLKNYFILSEAVKGYVPLPVGQQTQFNQGKYPGLGLLMIVAVFLQEIDLKYRNIGLDSEGQVTKIDGDWCFAAFRDAAFRHYNKDITSSLLNSLPFPRRYKAFNWLDLSQEGVAFYSSDIVDENLISAPHFRNEINEAILKILVLPDEYIKKFVEAFVPVTEKQDDFTAYLTNRRKELLCAALQNSSFKEYMLGEDRVETLQRHVLHMNDFFVNGTHSIVDNASKDGCAKAVMQLHDSVRENIFSNAFDVLKKIKLEYPSLSSTAELLAYRDKLLEQVNECMAGIVQPKKGQLLEQYNKLRAFSEETVNAIKSSSNQLKQHFLFLDRIHYAKYVEIFKQKQIVMQKKAEKSQSYKEASKAALRFCETLTHAKQTFLEVNLNIPFEQKKELFVQQCTDAITEAKKELDNHREWIGEIRRFFIEIISFLTKGLLGRKWSMFAKPDSVQKLDSFEQKIVHLNNIRLNYE